MTVLSAHSRWRRFWDACDPVSAIHRQRAEERDRYWDALAEIARQDLVDLVLDPTWAQRIARAVLDEERQA